MEGIGSYIFAALTALWIVGSVIYGLATDPVNTLVVIGLIVAAAVSFYKAYPRR